MRAYLDSCFLIYGMERRQPFADWVDRQFADLAAARASLVVSELTRLECRVGPIALGLDNVLADYDDFFSGARLIWQPISRNVFELATELRARHRIKTPDALHLAAAMTAGCERFLTNDARLRTAAGGKLDVVCFDGQANREEP